MNCLEFRREVLIAPNDVSDEAQAHELGCVGCAELASRLRGLDAKIDEAFRIPVPEQLVERVIASTSRSPEQSRRRFLAAAAGVSLAIGIGATTYWLDQDDPLALAGITFVVAEEANAILHAPPADRAQLVRVAQAMKLYLPEQLGEIRYVGTCPFEGTIAHHVIVTTPLGKATLLLLPEVAVDSTLTASARGLRARVIPAAVGSVAVVSGSERSLDRIGNYMVRV